MARIRELIVHPAGRDRNSVAVGASEVVGVTVRLGQCGKEASVLQGDMGQVDCLESVPVAWMTAADSDREFVLSYHPI